METPECNKILAVKDKSQIIGEFIDWLKERNIHLCTWLSGEEGEERLGYVNEDIETLLAQFFNIDLNKVEKEKQMILRDLQ
jgi:hypothetical protein